MYLVNACFDSSYIATGGCLKRYLDIVFTPSGANVTTPLRKAH